MKKVTKILIAAAAVAAVVGVGTVSFAKWSGGESGSATVEGTLAKIPMLKFGEPTTITITDKLLPIDEPDNVVVAGAKRVAKVEFKVDANYTSGSFELKITLANTGDISSETNFYATSSDKEDKADNPWDGDLIDPDDGRTIGYTIASSGTYEVYIFHDSSDPDDMGESFTLTFTVQNPVSTEAGD